MLLLILIYVKALAFSNSDELTWTDLFNCLQKTIALCTILSIIAKIWEHSNWFLYGYSKLDS